MLIISVPRAGAPAVKWIRAGALLKRSYHSSKYVHPLGIRSVDLVTNPSIPSSQPDHPPMLLDSILVAGPSVLLRLALTP